MILFDKKNPPPSANAKRGADHPHGSTRKFYSLHSIVRREWYPCRFASEPSSVISHSSFSVDATSTERVSLG